MQGVLLSSPEDSATCLVTNDDDVLHSGLNIRVSRVINSRIEFL